MPELVIKAQSLRCGEDSSLRRAIKKAVSLFMQHYQCVLGRVFTVFFFGGCTVTPKSVRALDLERIKAIPITSLSTELPKMVWKA